ncbi:MAG: DUF89 family protein [Deltaproteobacteria bacterium]|nr:DUF89 family protein [Deltaproteobacteria bacterium]
MRAETACLPCLRALARRAVRLAAAGDPALARRAEAECLSALERDFRAGVSVPTRLSSALLRSVRRSSGTDDPFREVKAAEYASGREAAARLRPQAGESLEGLLRLSGAGNQIDFFRNREEVERLWELGLPALALDDGAKLRAALARPGDVLFLADNAGEVPFDLPLLAALERGGKRVLYAVKGGPSQNDVTRADAERLGLRLPGLIDTGSDAVGCELREAGEDLARAWERAGTVLAKGMANWETLTEYPDALRGKAVFFLLCAKCEPVAASLGVEKGSMVLANARRVARVGAPA